jgi:hypothetical protein
MWGGLKKAAMTGAARVAVGAEQAARRLETQRRLGAQEAALEARYAALGRLVAGAARGGGTLPPGGAEHVAAAEALEAEVAALRAEVHRLGGQA